MFMVTKARERQTKLEDTRDRTDLKDKKTKKLYLMLHIRNRQHEPWSSWAVSSGFALFAIPQLIFGWNPYLQQWVCSKFRNGRVHFRKSEMKELKNYWIESLWKHAYSNILKRLPPRNENFQVQKKRKKKKEIISYFCSKHSLWVRIRTTTMRRF